MKTLHGLLVLVHVTVTAHEVAQVCVPPTRAQAIAVSISADVDEAPADESLAR